jgi:hypothetical protein
MAKNRAFELRLRDAAIHEQSFEFQLWENLFEDDELKRQNLLAIGAEEYMITLKGLIDGRRRQPDPLLSDDKMDALLAMAAMSDQVNLLQLEASRRPGNGFRALSMLDLLISGLKAKRSVDQGSAGSSQEPLSKYIPKVLMYEDEARYLLELRYAILPAIVVSKISDVDNAGFCEKLRLILAALKVAPNWTADFKKMNAAEIRLLTKYIRDAVSVRNAMDEMDQNTKLDGKLKAILQRAVLKEDPAAGPGKVQATQAFLETWDELIKGL